MPRVIGIDPGTISIDLCGLENGRIFLDESHPTRETLADPGRFLSRLDEYGPVDLVAGPSGYGLPFVQARDLTEADLRLAYLAPAGEAGGIGGLRTLARLFARSSIPTMFTPGVVHLASVPAHRKVNRVDMGTADKVCATVLALREEAERLPRPPEEVSFVLLELGGAFSAGVAVAQGRIVDGAGGTSGPMGLRAAGALDGEVAFLAGRIEKASLFTGGALSVAGIAIPDVDAFVTRRDARCQLAWEAFIEGALKTVAALAVSVPDLRSVVLSGRFAGVSAVRSEINARLATLMPQASLHVLRGFASVAKQAAQGAALLADGLAGGPSAPLVDAMGIREASGTVLDHLHVISPEAARARLGLS
jgi:predicted butyrate kinase (DUF1464 family)